MSYLSDAVGRPLGAAMTWPNSHGVEFTVICLFSGVVMRLAVMPWWPLSGEMRGRILVACENLGAVALAGLVVGFLLIFLFFLFSDPAEQIRIRDEQIAALGRAPDIQILTPTALRNSTIVLSAVDSISNLVNKEMRAVCDEAKAALVCVNNMRSAPVSGCLQKTQIAVDHGRLLFYKLWTDANRGLLVEGDPDVLGVLKQAIQQKDRQVFVDFNQYSGGTYDELYFLTLLTSDERSRLFEPAMNLSNAHNNWESATDRYCALIDKTKTRISEIRRQFFAP
jgi:hypothetical protein